MTLATDIFASGAAGPAPAEPSARVAIAPPEGSPAASLCAHCGSPVPPGLVDRAAAEQFCCAGCQAVYQILHSCGLDDYYRLRDAADAVAKPASLSADGFASFDSPTFYKLYVQNRPGGLAVVDLALRNVTCAACVWLIERLPRVAPGVLEARLSLREATVRVTFDPQQITLSRVGVMLDRLGYTPYPARGASAKDEHRRETRRRLVHLGVAGALMGNSMLLGITLYAGDLGHMEAGYRTYFRWISAGLGLLSLAWPGSTFFRSAYIALRAKTTNLDVPIAMALGVGGMAGLFNVWLNHGEIYFDSISVLIFLLLMGRFIQFRQQRRADDAVALLFSLTPSTCHLVRGEDVSDVPAEAIHPGDLLEVRPGELLPVDGVVETGNSSVNSALLTGESLPAVVRAGSAVHAGAQNVASILRVRAEAVGADTRVGKLMKLIEQGVADKPPIVQFADRMGGYFVIVLTIVSVLVFGYWSRISLALAIDHTVALLIVTCPCVLGLATPLTIAVAIGRLARQDILLKSGAVLERLSRRGALLLDKTGTITEGRMTLLKWVGDDVYRAVTAQVERKSNHPVGRALCGALNDADRAETQLLNSDAGSEVRRRAGFLDDRSGSSAYLRTGVIVENVVAALTNIEEKGDGGIAAHWNGRQLLIGAPRFIQSRGVSIPTHLAQAALESEREGATTILVAVDDTAVALAALGDAIRDDSASAIAELKRLGWRPAILSGDAQAVVSSVSARVGIDADLALGNLSPEQKLARVSRREPGSVSVMVGDGVNDAAALAAAEVGIAVQGGAEASLSAADVYIARPGLTPIVELVRMSRRTLATVRRNLCLSLAYNVVAGTLAAMGLMSPLRAAIVMPISSSTVLALAMASIARGKSEKVESRE